MASKATLVTQHSFEKTHAILVDTNVWYYVHAPLPPQAWQAQVYSTALKRILEAQSAMFVDVLVLSEFANRLARFEFARWQQNYPSTQFKDFRQSSHFPHVAKAVADSLRRILKHSQIVGTGFESVDAKAFLSNYEANCPDFNDQALVELCKREGFMLLSHDGDFKDAGITVLTANTKLLG